MSMHTMTTVTVTVTLTPLLTDHAPVLTPARVAGGLAEYLAGETVVLTDQLVPFTIVAAEVVLT